MSKHQSAPKCRQYPAYCFRNSTTYDAWVKLTAADVQALRSEPEYQSQRIYFYLNHPIRYVRFVGVVVAIEDINAKYTVLILDDGSGATIEVKIIRLTPAVYNPVESPSNTMIENVDVRSGLGVFEVRIDQKLVDIGTVIKTDCTISEFRGWKQLELKRARIVATTDEEARAWAETAAFKRDVLSVPWRVSSAEHKEIKRRIKAEKREVQEYQEYERRKAEHDMRKKKRQMDHRDEREAKLEAHRRKLEAIMNEGALI